MNISELVVKDLLGVKDVAKTNFEKLMLIDALISCPSPSTSS